MGTLRVLKKTADGEATTLWKRSFMQGTNWMFANVEIYCKEKFQVNNQSRRAPQIFLVSLRQESC